MSRVLVVEDDPAVLEILRRAFEAEGFSVTDALSGEEARTRAAESQHDVALVGTRLPDVDSATLARQLHRDHGIRSSFVASKADEDAFTPCIRKPISPPVAVAEVRRLLRLRSNGRSVDREPRQVGDLTIDFALRDVVVRGRRLGLTRKEFALVALLAQKPNTPVARDQLFERVWGYALDFNSNSLDVYIYRIRRRIEEDPACPKYLQTVRGVGYQLVDPSLPVQLAS